MAEMPAWMCPSCGTWQETAPDSPACPTCGGPLTRVTTEMVEKGTVARLTFTPDPRQQHDADPRRHGPQ